MKRSPSTRRPDTGKFGVAAEARVDPAVQSLMRRARRHPLGLDFLRKGLLDSVAATFQVHAFVVESARERLK